VLVPVVKVEEKMFLSPHFGRAPGFAVYEVSNGNVTLVEYVENPYKGSHEHSGHGRQVLDFIMSLRPGVVVVKSIGAGAFYRLKEAGVPIYLSNDRMAEEALAKLVRGELEELSEPNEDHTH
ncbi:MAG: NifB/NifX family molybdenum-iron cluster-binding protein, partial [Infirmifilum sp.]